MQTVLHSSSTGFGASCVCSSKQRLTRRPPCSVPQQACSRAQHRNVTTVLAWQQESAPGSAPEPLLDLQYAHHKQQEGAAPGTVLQQTRVDADADEQKIKERKADVMMLLHKNNATETLIELRSARIASLAAALISRGLKVPTAASLAAAGSSSAHQDVLAQVLAGQAETSQLSNYSHDALLQRNQALMQRSRAQGIQIQAMESALQRAGVPLPRRTLESTSLSSASGSFSSAGSVSEDEVSTAATAGAARAGVVAAACVTSVRPAQRRVCQHIIRCQFKVHCVTHPGDRVMIVGSHPALGSWDAEHGGALMLTWNADHVWTGTMSLEWQPGDYSPQMVSFKAVLQCKDGSMVWQKGGNHEMILGPLMGHHVTPALATIEFDGDGEPDGLPLNYQEACTTYYNNHYDSEVPEAYAKKKASHEVQQSIKRMRQQLASQSSSTSC